ncbi:hypothetical protein KTD19_27995 [Burkholderia multivorans]|uniref:hypothetical protein n=1 Tax=Burkholderia multivorans TaxID=87883 RepID=UPI001C22AEE0|nr:hypothetical protein [Burkholderia multivorans]MBU9236220.1 hypothetical protein [Burkholderia multivorans]
MQKKITALVLLVAGGVLAGCATVRQTYAPDGRVAYALNCSGLARGWDKCLAAAGDKCGSAGYDILDRSGELTAAASANRTAGFGAISGERAMVIACKESKM